MLSMSGVLSSAIDQSGPEMPPSLRMRQKCTAISTAVTSGTAMTCRTYQRTSVPTPAPPGTGGARDDMRDDPAHRLFIVDLETADQEKPRLLAHKWSCACHVRADCYRPDTELVPREQVAGEAEEEGAEQQD